VLIGACLLLSAWRDRQDDVIGVDLGAGREQLHCEQVPG
jgi:hypothetical protein